MQSSKNLLVYDGVLRTADAPLFKSTNRAFRYGDAIFETIRFHKGEPLFWPDHYRRLLNGMAVLRFSVKGFPSSLNLKESIIDVVVKNRIFSDARIRLTVFRKGEGLYTPDSLNASWIIESSELPHKGYDFPEKGLLIGVYRDFPKQVSPVSMFKTCFSLPYVMGGIYSRENEYDDCLLVNDKGKLIESVSASLFWIKGNNLYTPLISSGCIEGIMRKQIINIAPLCGLKLIENQGASEEEILTADEVFLTNTIGGIRWVSGFKENRYFATKTKELYRKLKELYEI
jgi:branched-subunit amino acid aminotransferase/4-amino-4-deoxychorismate lyase